MNGHLACVKTWFVTVAFIDESGDAGLKVARGSSPLFTVAVVVFNGHGARSCQAAMEKLRTDLKMSPHQEFHFHSDSHPRRLELLDVIRDAQFRLSAFTLNKTSPRLDAPGYRFKDSLYKNICKMSLQNAAELLAGARVVVDGSGDRTFKRQLTTYLQRNVLGPDGKPCVARVTIKRSESDPLLQVADYCAGIINRRHSGKPGADDYYRRIRKKVVQDRLWP